MPRVGPPTRKLVPSVAILPLAFLAAGCSDDPSPKPIPDRWDLLYLSNEPGGFEVVRRPLDGGPSVPVFAGGGAVAFATPAPDGRRLAYVVESIDEEFDILVVDLDDPDNPVPLAQTGFSEQEPDWSPDGAQICFSSDRDGLGDIFVVNADGTNLRQITFDPLPGRTNEFWPRWSPDGTRIAFGSNQSGSTDIWTMAPDGSDARRLTTGADIESRPTWSPDGARIAFRILYSPSSGDIGVMNADGTSPVIFVDPGQDEHPAWSPDGTLIAYHSNRDGGDFEIWTIRPDGTGRLNRTNNAVQDLLPAWIRVLEE
jgi:Tol biopolymer transport system component